MNGPSGVLWPKIIMMKKMIRINIIGIIHHSLFLAKKRNKLAKVANLVFND